LYGDETSRAQDGFVGSVVQILSPGFAVNGRASRGETCPSQPYRQAANRRGEGPWRFKTLRPTVNHPPKGYPERDCWPPEIFSLITWRRLRGGRSVTAFASGNVGKYAVQVP
jgi:hypothetical protein